MEVQGKIIVKGETQTFGSNGFRKRELVIVDDSNSEYPQYISIDFTQDKCDLLDSFNIGDNVKISINVGGRIWVNPEGVSKYFNSIQGWRIGKVEAGATPEPLPTHAEQEDNSLPF